jgi:hypothetical protein
MAWYIWQAISDLPAIKISRSSSAVGPEGGKIRRFHWQYWSVVTIGPYSHLSPFPRQDGSQGGGGWGIVI